MSVTVHAFALSLDVWARRSAEPPTVDALLARALPWQPETAPADD